MRKKKENYSWILWAIGIFLIIRNVATGGILRSLFLTPNQLAEMYRDMVESNPSITYTVVRGGKEIPVAIDLARGTRNYAAVKEAYTRIYNRDMSADLITYFGSVGYINLSDYVAELWSVNQQVMS